MTAEEGLREVNELATQTAASASAWVSDFLILIVLFGAFFTFVWFAGRAALVSLLVALYGAYAVFELFPYHSLLPDAPPFTALGASIGLYVAFTLVFYIILRRVIVSDFLYIGLFGTLALSFLGAAFLLALAYHVFPVTELYTFSPAVDALFASKHLFFWWFVAPVIGLFLLAH